MRQSCQCFGGKLWGCQAGFGGATADRATPETARADLQSQRSENPPKAEQGQPPDLGVGVVGVPGGAQGLLAPDVPHQEARVVHHDLLHVAADGGRGVNHLVHGAAQEQGQGVTHRELHPTERASANSPWVAKTRFGGGRCRNVNKNGKNKSSVNCVIIKL